MILDLFVGNVSDEKLDLFEFTSCLMTEANTCSAQIVWSASPQFAAPSLTIDLA